MTNITGQTFTVNNSTLLDTGQMTGGTITANSSAIDVLGTMTGGTVTLNSSSLMVGQGSSAVPSVTGGEIVYGTGLDSVALAKITSSNSTQIVGFNDGDSIAESNIAFNSATLSGHTITLKENGTTVATFNNVTLAAGASSTFYPTTTEVIGGVTYYVATLDPPSSGPTTTTTGATGVDVAGITNSGTITLNSGANLMAANATGGTITYGTGADSVEFKHIAKVNSTALLNVNANDSIAEPNIAFNSATLSGHTLTLKENGITVAKFNDVTLAPNAPSAKFVTSTEVIGGTTYYVAKLDPPTGSAGTGTHDPLTAPINQNTVFGNLDHGHGKFLQGNGTTPPNNGAPDTGKLAGLDQGNLGQTLTHASKQLLADLTNIGKLLNNLGHGSNDPFVGSGQLTTPQINGIGGVLGNLDNGGKPDFKDLLTHNTTIVPRH